MPPPGERDQKKIKNADGDQRKIKKKENYLSIFSNFLRLTLHTPSHTRYENVQQTMSLLQIAGSEAYFDILGEQKYPPLGSGSFGEYLVYFPSFIYISLLFSLLFFSRNCMASWCSMGMIGLHCQTWEQTQSERLLPWTGCMLQRCWSTPQPHNLFKARGQIFSASFPVKFIYNFKCVNACSRLNAINWRTKTIQPTHTIAQVSYTNTREQ